MDGTGKSQATLIGGALTTILVYVLDTYVLKTPLPDFVVTALTTIICVGCAYFTPHSASVANLLPSRAVKSAVAFFAIGIVATTLMACAAKSTTTNTLGNQFATVLSRIMNTSAADLITAENVANAATPPDKDGASCAAAIIVVQSEVNNVVQAQAAGTQGAFTTAEMLSLFQPGSAQFNQAYNVVAAGCIAKANDVMGAANVLLAGGIAGVLAATNTVIPLGAAIP